MLQAQADGVSECGYYPRLAGLDHLTGPSLTI